jgi:hypothetical protein
VSGRVGTQEAKRRRRAVPDPEPDRLLRILVVIALIYLGACLAWRAATRSLLPIVLAVPAVLGLWKAIARHLHGSDLLSRVRKEWAPRGIRCLVVHSRSQTWSMHVRSRWLPRLGSSAATLDWSERSTWPPESLEAQVFKQFCGSYRNFNPAVVVFRERKPPLVFRFFYAFQEAKGGRHSYLDDLEKQMFEALGDPG